ncbi:MAG: tyrosine-type recombinase/integrase [Spirochaetaceae bacterium]|nr:tyrosine-type recombinase/integrase [Spirochaetaceae bacterium]
MALDLLALSVVSVANSIATLSAAYDHAIRLCAAAHVLRMDAATARVVAALTDAYCAKNTRRAYVRGWERWRTWASEHGVRSFPAAPKWVAVYLTARAESGRAPATVHVDRAAIGAAHRAVGAVDPTASRAVRRALRSIGATYCNRGRGQVEGLDWEDVDRTAALAESDGSLAGLRDAALLRLGSDALLRVSELASLVVSDLFVKPDGSGTITVRRSKTDQHGRGHVRYVGRSTVDAVRRYLQAAGIEAGALFCGVNKGGAVRAGLGVRSIRRIITQRAAAAGIVGRISGHSLRVGAVQSLVAAGASLVDLQRAGDWKSPSMPGHYARHQLAERGAVARLRHGVAA